ncbi:MAG: ATP-binding cassette domain-containing protein [Clostridiales bacterium]|nr:ATP-binding cassette domain-containing protein [Clostridiales bacterium]
MITINDISLVLRGERILDHINLSMEAGNIYGLTGNNGSGKTMLMKCICGFVTPTSGEVIVDGKVIGKDMDYLPDAGVIIETPGFIPYYSGFKNLKLLADIRYRITDDEVRSAMTTVGLDPSVKLPVRKYSLGMRQRLGLAQALMEDPSILILDEPMNGLDKAGVEEIRKLLLMLKRKGKLILLASHNAEDICILCDEVYDIEAGAICAVNKKAAERRFK